MVQHVNVDPHAVAALVACLIAPLVVLIWKEWP